jgi:ABC-type multidrug transport system permease subunit
VPIIALLIALLFESDALRTGSAGDPADGSQLLFLVVITAIWLGSIYASREIIKERALMERERAVGVKLGAYLASKAVVLFALVALQCLLLVSIVFGLRSLDEGATTYLVLLGILAVTGFVAVGMGLFVSSIVSSEDQAASIIPLILIPQLLFAGAIIAVKDMSSVVAALSNLVFARWAFAAAGSAIDMNARIAADPSFSQLDKYGSSFFSLSVPVGLLILGGFLVVFLLATAAVLTARKGES